MGQISFLSEGVAVFEPPQSFDLIEVVKAGSRWKIEFHTKAGVFFVARKMNRLEPMTWKSLDSVLARLEGFGLSGKFIVHY